MVGPFVLALLPTRGIGELARTYAINVMVFGAWGLIYAIFQVLMSAINLNSIDAVLNSNGVLNSFIGSGSMILLALVSILFSIAIAFIPFFASRIVRGDVGSTMLALGGTALAVASAAATMAGKALTSGGSGFGFATIQQGPRPRRRWRRRRWTGRGRGQIGGVLLNATDDRRLRNTGERFDGDSDSGGGSPPPSSPPKPWRENIRPGQPQNFSFADYAFWWGGYGLGKVLGPRGKQ